MTQHVLSELQDRVLTIRFNRPDKKNALTTEMYVAFTEALQRAGFPPPAPPAPWPPYPDQ